MSRRSTLGAVARLGRRQARSWAVAGLLGPFVTHTVSAQVTRVIDERIGCSRCVIALDTVAVLKDPYDSLGLSRGVSSLLQSRSGGYVVTALNPANGAPILFDSTGAFRRFLGRHGGGPAEYRAARRVVTYRHDSILVFDPGVARIAVLSGDLQRGRLVLEPTLSRATDVVSSPDGQLVVSTLVRGRDQLGFPLHKYSPELRLVRSMGDAGGRFSSEQAHAHQRLLARSSDGTFWAAHRSRYLIERWDTSGVVLARLERRAPWFEAHEFQIPAQNPFPAWPVILDVEEDDDRRLWVVSTISDKRWREAFGPARTNRSGQQYFPLEDPHRYQDTMIELLDFEKTQVVARIRLDDVASVFSAGRLLAFVRSDVVGIRVILVRPRMQMVP